MPLVTSTKTIAATNYSGSSPFESLASGAHPLAPFFRGAAYDLMYSQGLWPAVAVDKLTTLQVVLPQKTYDRLDEEDRADARSSPFGRLMAKPSTTVNPFVFRRWMTSMHHIYGAAFAKKVRDFGRGGIPVELIPVHPTRMRYGPKGGQWVNAPISGEESGDNFWWIREADNTETKINRRDFLFWPRFDPASPNGWMSPFEPLRETLEAEHTIRRSNRAMWRNGGRHQIALTHPSRFNNPATTKALRDQYAEKYAGVDNDGKPLVLQEGMKVEALPYAQELAYVDTRKLNREEVAARFDIPPPAIHILDRATFSNIETQVRMLYSITIPPHVTSYEAAIEFDVRDGSFGEGPPDFGDRYYHELLLDGALRGDFETRIDTYAKAIQTGQMTPAESRANENRPYIEGSDKLLINAAVVPIEEASKASAVEAADTPLPDDGTVVDEGVSTLAAAMTDFVMKVMDAQLLAGSSATTVPALPVKSSPALTPKELSTVMGRAGRAETVGDIEVGALVDGLSQKAAALVESTLGYAVAAGSSVPQFRQAIKELAG